jgi:hypothetical protein
MMYHVPYSLIAIAVIYLASEIAMFLILFKLSGLIRIALYATVLILAIRGSRRAANIWGCLSILGAVIAAYTTFFAARQNVLGALLLGSYGAFFLLSATYIFTSRNLAQFYRQRQSTALTGNNDQ